MCLLERVARSEGCALSRMAGLTSCRLHVRPRAYVSIKTEHIHCLGESTTRVFLCDDDDEGQAQFSELQQMYGQTRARTHTHM